MSDGSAQERVTDLSPPTDLRPMGASGGASIDAVLEAAPPPLTFTARTWKR